MAGNTERIYRLGCFTIKERPARSPQERAVAMLRERTDGELSSASRVIERKAQAIADAMEVLHGERFEVTIRHDRPFVLVFPSS